MAQLHNVSIMTVIASNLQAVNHAITQAAHAAQRRREEVMVLAVSKTFSTTAVSAAFAAGQRSFGENYLQEALEKIAALRSLPLEWHFIGPLQSNKTRAIAENFSWVHSVDRLNIAERLAAQRPAHLPPLNLCIQVNISGEPSKSGVAFNDAAQLAQAVARLPQLHLRGLMAIPAPAADLPAQRAPYAALRRLLLEINRAHGLQLDTLSMGMSHDLEAAVLEGATIVRIGTAIFGARQNPSNN
jgi:pyridoxal phosphate enzyme (YggS family)